MDLLVEGVELNLILICFILTVYQNLFATFFGVEWRRKAIYVRKIKVLHIYVKCLSVLQTHLDLK